MRLVTTIVVLSLALFGAVLSQPNTCIGWAAADWESVGTAFEWYFGANDGDGSTAYYYALYPRNYITDLYTYNDGDPYIYQTSWTINQVPIQGGLNMTRFGGGPVYETYTPTANFTCLTNYSGIWGPSHPDYRLEDGNPRSSHPNIEVFVHYSAPAETSYLRTVLFIKNTGSQPDRVRLSSLSYVEGWPTDVSPIDNEGRYYTVYAFEQTDNGQYNTNPAATFSYKPVTLHTQGQKGREQFGGVTANIDGRSLTTTYHTVLAPGQEFAFMSVMSFGTNVSSALKNAAEIDAEPENIFHDLTADQLSMIRNWGGCQAIIGPTATVTVTPPAQCSTGLTSDFTVQASSSRTDLTADFTHRVVVGAQNFVLVAAQSSTTLSVPNGAGAVRHQLWYKECLVKETEFTACTTAAAPVAPVASAPVASTVPVASTPAKKSGASSLAVASLLSLVGVVAVL